MEKLSEEVERTDGQGNSQCPSCRRQGGHITSLAGLAKAQYDRMGACGLLCDVNHVPSCGKGESGSVEIVEEGLCLASPPPRDADSTRECSGNRDVVLESFSQILIQNGSVAAEELDENGNNASMHRQLGGFLSKPGENNDGGDDDKEDELPSITDDMIQMTTQEMAIRKKVTFDLDLSQRGDIFDLEIAESTTVESMSSGETDNSLINGSEREVANIDVDSGDGDSQRMKLVSASEAFSCGAITEGSIGDGRGVTAIGFLSDDALIQEIPGPGGELSGEVARSGSELPMEVAMAACDLSQEVARPDSELLGEIEKPASELSLGVAPPASELSHEIANSTCELSQEISGPASELPECIPGLSGESTHNRSDTPSQVGTECQPDEDRLASEITMDVETSHDPCPAALTDDEKWTEMFEKSEVRHGDIEPASGDGARQPKQRRRQEKVRSADAARI